MNPWLKSLEKCLYLKQKAICLVSRSYGWIKGGNTALPYILLIPHNSETLFLTPQK